MTLSTDAHVGQGEVAQRGAGRQLRQELQGVAEELQRAQVRQAPQVQHRRRQAVVLKRHLPQLAAVPQLHCAVRSFVCYKWNFIGTCADGLQGMQVVHAAQV